VPLQYIGKVVEQKKGKSTFFEKKNLRCDKNKTPAAKNISKKTKDLRKLKNARRDNGVRQIEKSKKLRIKIEPGG
jgi:hypothetical protein